MTAHRTPGNGVTRTGHRRTRECALRHRESSRVLATRCQVACTFWARLRGWIGRRPADGEALWLAPCASVHTVGMRAPIDVLFCASDGAVIKAVRRLRPYRFAGARGAVGACELPSGAAAGVVPGDHLDRVDAAGRARDQYSSNLSTHGSSRSSTN